ncbi:unnamed protein product [Amoebophrya sp. A120]|nr:unnamed protein product [Amoebophrya sp. A120]|eukprot:GSA120T00003478001.1
MWHGATAKYMASATVVYLLLLQPGGVEASRGPRDPRSPSGRNWARRGVTPPGHHAGTGHAFLTNTAHSNPTLQGAGVQVVAPQGHTGTGQIPPPTSVAIPYTPTFWSFNMLFGTRLEVHPGPWYTHFVANRPTSVPGGILKTQNSNTGQGDELMGGYGYEYDRVTGAGQIVATPALGGQGRPAAGGVSSRETGARRDHSAPMDVDPEELRFLHLRQTYPDEYQAYLEEARQELQEANGLGQPVNRVEVERLALGKLELVVDEMVARQQNRGASNSGRGRGGSSHSSPYTRNYETRECGGGGNCWFHSAAHQLAIRARINNHETGRPYTGEQLRQHVADWLLWKPRGSETNLERHDMLMNVFEGWVTTQLQEPMKAQMKEAWDQHMRQRGNKWEDQVRQWTVPNMRDKLGNPKVLKWSSYENFKKFWGLRTEEEMRRLWEQQQIEEPSVFASASAFAPQFYKPEQRVYEQGDAVANKIPTDHAQASFEVGDELPHLIKLPLPSDLQIVDTPGSRGSSDGHESCSSNDDDAGNSCFWPSSSTSDKKQRKGKKNGQGGTMGGGQSSTYEQRYHDRCGGGQRGGGMYRPSSIGGDFPLTATGALWLYATRDGNVPHSQQDQLWNPQFAREAVCAMFQVRLWQIVDRAVSPLVEPEQAMDQKWYPPSTVGRNPLPKFHEAALPDVQRRGFPNPSARQPEGPRGGEPPTIYVNIAGIHATSILSGPDVPRANADQEPQQGRGWSLWGQ